MKETPSPPGVRFPHPRAAAQVRQPDYGMGVLAAGPAVAVSLVALAGRP